MIDDGVFDILDRNCRAGDTQNAGAFTGRRTDAAGKFRKVVGFVQPF
jgi:hypothetical protein